MEYLDFDLEVTAADGGAFAVRVLRSPAGEAIGTMRLPFDELVLQNRLQALQIALLRSGTTRRRVDTAESHTVAQFGEELWDALFAGDVGERFEASRSEARRLDAGMRIKLRFEDAALAALPWEYLFDAGRGDYVTLSASTPLVRYISLPQSHGAARGPPAAARAGHDRQPVGSRDARRRSRATATRQALDKPRRRGADRARLDDGSTSRDLQAMLRRGPWHIFHFVGHGGFDTNRGEGLIVLTTTRPGPSNWVSATDLGRLLGDHDPLRLAVLNACESARGDSVDVFASTAATLVRRGTPAVVAMQYEITDDAAIEFSRSFYEAIADDIPVDAALAEARKGVAMAIPGTLEWGTPVLYMRAPDGVLFDIPPEARAAAMAAAAAAAAVPAPPAVEPPPAESPEAPPAAPPVVEPPAPEPAIVEAPAAAAVAPQVAQPPPPAPVVRSPEPTAPATAPVPAWSAPVATAGAGRATGRNTKAIVAVVGVVVFVGVVALAALGEMLGSATAFPPDDTPVPTSAAGPIVNLVTPDPNVIVPPVAEGRRIVFANDGNGDTDLFSVDSTGTQTLRLTSDAADDRYPAWSPDGSRIAFTRMMDGQGDLWTMAADGSDPRQVTTGTANDWAPAWTTDGQRLVFSTNRNETNPVLNDVWTVRPDGTEPQPLAGELDRQDATAVMGPGDRQLAFSSNRDGDAQSIYLLDTVTRSLTRLTRPGWIDAEPVWSIDGVTLLFARASDQNPADGDLWSVRTDGVTTQVTTEEVDEGHPVYSPDGLTIVFQRVVDGSYHIIVGNTFGTVDVTRGLSGNSVEPTWR